ncbi:hypothetical protein D3C73_815920 [compost metagenome]
MLFYNLKLFLTPYFEQIIRSDLKIETSSFFYGRFLGTSPRKLNTQAILDIVKKDLVWPELQGSPYAIHYYHLTDVLGRKWQTSGCHVTMLLKFLKWVNFRLEH